MKRRLTFELGVTRQKYVTPDTEIDTLKGYAALGTEDDSDFSQGESQARAITNPSGSRNAGLIVQQNSSRMSQGLKRILLTILLIGISFVIVTHLTDAINRFVSSPIAKCMGLSYSRDHIVLLYDKVFDLAIEIARIILVGFICLHAKALGH
jgi:hypothetical protein